MSVAAVWGFLKSLGNELLLLLVIFVLRLVGVDVFQRMRWLARLVRDAFCLIVRKHQTILLFMDCDDKNAAANRMKDELLRGFPKNHLTIRILRDGEQFLYRPVFRWNIHAVCIFLTDVTPLSAVERRRESIQRKLSKFVERGGILVLSHDALYRRSRNVGLQTLAGCQLTSFTPVSAPITYVKYDKGSRRCRDEELLDRLPLTFQLSDREWVTGHWAHDVEYLYVLQGSDIPLVTRRAYAKGVTFWLNSGDSNHTGPPESIALPDRNLATVLGELLKRSRAADSIGQTTTSNTASA